MLDKRAERYTKELQDPALSALLREAMENDPVCADSPGRTDRIMRKVLSEGVRPVARRPWWAPLALATGSLAASAAAVLLLLGSVHLPATNDFAALPPANPPAVPHTVPTQDTQPRESTPPKIPEVQEKRATPWIDPVAAPRSVQGTHDTVARINGSGRTENATLITPREAEPAASTQQVAAALYDAGSAAHAVGDYTTAYDAYQASYELEPTPDALLASGDALEQIAKEALNSEESPS